MGHFKQEQYAWQYKYDLKKLRQIENRKKYVCPGIIR